MTTSVETIVNDVSVMLQDINKDRWSDGDMLTWVTESQQLIATHKPDAVATLASVVLVAGVDQALPTDAVMMLRVRRNTASGRTVQLIDEDSLNAVDPNWPGAVQTLDATNCIYDSELNPLEFMVSPPNNGSGSIEMVYAKIPAPITDTADNLSVNDSYAPLVKDYVMYRALMMETEGQSLPRSSQHLQVFLQGLGLNTEALATKSPMQEVEDND